MSISKLLMTAAVCAMSMVEVSKSYGASTESFQSAAEEADLPTTESMRNFTAHDGSNATLAIPARGSRAVESDSMSLRSTTSTISHDRLAVGLKKIFEFLKPLPRNVIFPNGVATSGTTRPSQIDIICIACSNLVDAYNGLLKISMEKTQEAARTEASLVRILDKAKSAGVEKGKKTELETIEPVEDQIVAAMDKREKALTEAETSRVEAENSAIRWKSSTMVTTTVLTLVAGILLNIIRNNGWTIVFGGK